MMYRHDALITGRGAFPVDMLRYDAAYPATSQDVLEIVNSLDPESGNRKYWVRVSKRTDAKIDTFTAGQRHRDSRHPRDRGSKLTTEVAESTVRFVTERR